MTLAQSCRAHEHSTRHGAEAAHRIGQTVNALKLWCKDNCAKTQGGTDACATFKERVKGVAGMGPSKAHHFLNFHLLE